MIYGQTRTEYGVRLIWRDGSVIEPEEGLSRTLAETRVRLHRQYRDERPNWLIKEAILMSREITVGEWGEVTDAAEPVRHTGEGTIS